MTVSYKILGQSNPSANLATDVYTVPNGASAVVSTLNVCNMAASGSADSLIKIAVRRNGETLLPHQYIVYNTPIAASDSISLTIGITLAANDVITVFADNTNTSFNVFGSELT